MTILSKMKERQEHLTNEHGLFKNEDGAIDLASIMVGVIVIGLIGGVIAATVFAVIPWTQDNAAKQQLDSVVAAQSAYVGLSSGVPPAVPAGHAANSYASSAQLEEANLLKAGPKLCTVTTDEGKGYIAFTKSDADKIWAATNKNTKPVIHTGTLPTDCQFLAGGSDPNDIDGDGIPNDIDRDADGDGVQDNYVPGGPIATLDGTSAPTSGTYYTTRLSAGATTITSNASNSSAPSSRKIAMHFLVTCVKDDGSFYKRNFLNGYTASASSYNTNFNTVPCATGERIDEYTVKPVTQEALASGQLENADYWGGWTFVFNSSPGGVHWSEPDGYPKSGTFQSSLLTGGGSTLRVVVQNANGTATTSGFQYKATCERADKSTYSLNRLASWTSRQGYIEYTTFNLTPCDSDRIINYDVFSTAKLGEVDNRSIFEGRTITGGKSWTEADGYPTSGSFVSGQIVEGGSKLNATFRNATSTQITRTTQYTMQCERDDKTTYSVNRLASWMNNYNAIENRTLGLTGCGTDRITAYEIFPVNSLGDVADRTPFAGYGMTGTKSWSEEVDGYQTSGSFQYASVSTDGTKVNATFRNSTSAQLVLTTQYTMTCERPDLSTYSVNRLASWQNAFNTIENRTLALGGCGTDKVKAYNIFPVNRLGDVANRSAFAGYGMAGSYSWTRP